MLIDEPGVTTPGEGEGESMFERIRRALPARPATGSTPRMGIPESGRARLSVILAAVAALVITLMPVAGQAQEPNQVTGVTITQAHGFTTVKWVPVPTATDYQIARTPVNAENEPTGTEVIVGLWRPNRQVTQDVPTFADAGYAPGGRFQWRVRARFGTTAQPYSEPVFGTTLPQWGNPETPGENLRTQWETSLAAQFTSDVNEYAYTEALDAASDRVRVVEIGRTALNRPINMFVIGYPAPPATAAEIAAGSAALVNCNVHGNEPSSRESCMIMARELAFGTDARTIDILSNTTVLIVPSINGDGRASNSRGNSTGQDLNRDYSLIAQPETFAFVRMLRDYRPQAAFDGHEYGNNTAGDLPVLPPRHLNVAQSIFDQSQDMITRHMYDNGSEDGWWFCPYGCQGGATVGMSEETILRNTMGLKNTMGSLLEARSGGGATRPDEGNTQNNRRRKTYSTLYTYNQFLDYFVANKTAIHAAVDSAIGFQVQNSGRIVFRGSRTIEPFPAPHPGESPPNQQIPTAEQILEEPPCGYLLSDAQYNGTRTDGPAGQRTTLNQRIDAHGWTVEDRPAGFLVRMRQEQRGLIPLLLDAQAAEEWTSGVRLSECPSAATAQDSLDAAAVENTQTSLTLTIANETTEENQPLNWTITEAAENCASPSDLGWVSAAVTAGTTAPSSTTDVTVNFDATGLTAPDLHTGVLCVSSNDSGAPVITVAVSLQVQYPLSGLAVPPGMGNLAAGRQNPIEFSLSGDRGLAIFSGATPTSAPLDCATLEVTGPEIRTTGNPLSYSAAQDVYLYRWLVPTAWAGTCRTFTVALDDGSSHTFYFRVRR